MSAFSYGTAYFSAVIFIGFAGKMGWNFGLSTFWLILGNTIIGSFLAWQVLGKKTREITHRLSVSTMPSFLGKRYKSKNLESLTAFIIFFFLVPYSASIYKGLNYLFEGFGIPSFFAYLMIAALTAIYLYFGGFVAATLADFVQGCIMLLGVFLMVFFLSKNPEVGGFSNILSNLGTIDPMLVTPINEVSLIPVIGIVLLTSIGSWGLPQMIHKFYTIKSEKAAVSAKWVSTAFAFVITSGAVFIGMVSRIFFPDEASKLANGITNPDMIIPKIMSIALPEWVSALILVLVISASMSTLASLVLASSSVVTLDVLKGRLKPELSGRHTMATMKILCVLFVILSFILAVVPNNYVLSLMALSWGLVSGCLLAPYLLGLYWRNTTKSGVWAGIISALSIMLGGAYYYGINSVYMPAVGSLAMIAPIFVIILVSLVTKPFDQEHINYIYNDKK
ncbi:sodium:solute symporter family protein [Methanococcus vannielii]|uniref:sodium:solute symporter family protein n=1 Tax=Methanococcus vannielii TaxID=2187 RepID=UPI0000F0AD0B|nr:sodium:solute symporter [Methanococcus vannielii]